MKSFFGGVLGALAIAGVFVLSQARVFSSSSSLAALPSVAGAPANGPAMPLVNCGMDRLAVTRQALVGQQVVTQVDCVAAAPAAVAQPEVRTVTHTVVRESAPRVRRVVEPTYVQSAYGDRVIDGPIGRETSVRQGRTWKKSALIIGGSAAGGAGVGAILDGGSGAKKGAVVGGLAGVVYDLATRNK